MIPFWMLFVCWIAEGGASLPAASSPRARAIATLDAGQTGEAQAILDSLLAADPTDGEAAYWRARIEEQAGRPAPARARYLALEAGASGSDVARLAEARRRALERHEADRLLDRGVADAGREDGPPTILLLPPEALTDDAGFPLFGLTWSYLVSSAMRGCGYSPVPIPSMLVVADLLRTGRALRAPETVSFSPVNAVEGLRARLAVLPDPSGVPYLASPAGEWDAALEEALIRFQQASGLPSTGEADLGTQARLEAQIERWLTAPPAPVEPKLLPRAAELLGASIVVRGTYRREGSEVEVSLSLLEPDGTARRGEPIVTRFRPGRVTEATREAAQRIAERLDTTLLTPESAWSMPAEELERATETLLLVDRGLPQPAVARWLRGPQVWFDWPMLASVRAVLSAAAESPDQVEAALRRSWLRPAGLDARGAMDAFSRQTGLPVSGAGRAPEPSPFGVLGDEGLLHIQGSGR